MMHALMHWEHTNYTLKTKNWLEHRVYIKKKKKKKKKPQILKTHFQKVNQIE